MRIPEPRFEYREDDDEFGRSHVLYLRWWFDGREYGCQTRVLDTGGSDAMRVAFGMARLYGDYIGWVNGDLDS